jgi:hypothetical protein
MFYTALASGGSLLFEPNRLTIYYVHPSSMRPGGRRSDPAEFVRTLAEFQLQTQDYGLTLPKESGVGRAAAALHSEWELVLALVSQTSRRTAVRRFVEFVKRGWASRKRLVVMASFVMCAKLIFPHFGESLFLAMRQIIQD